MRRFNSRSPEARADDGYYYTGIWFRSYQNDEAKERAKEERAKGFKARCIQKHGGIAVLVKDTPKTLEAAKLKEEKEEKKRVEQAVEVAAFLKKMSDEIAGLSLYKLQTLKREVEKVLEGQI